MRLRFTATAFVALVVAAALTGCSNDPLAAQYRDGTDSNYISGQGVYKEFTPAERKAPVVFSGTADSGATISSTQYAGKVLVVNFWYAGCPPCRKEAPLLVGLAKKYDGKVDFLGVNTFDQAATSLAFGRTFGVNYPSIIDANTVSVQFAFSASVPPNAVPTTLVIDRQGRVAARISGLIRDKSILAGMIDTVVAEGQ